MDFCYLPSGLNVSVLTEKKERSMFILLPTLTETDMIQ